MTGLDAARRASLDSLLRALDIQACGAGRYRAPGEPGQFPHTFGGQLLAQALMAASTTVEDKTANSVHAYFATPGEPTEPIDIDVRVVRDGRAMSTREVSLQQDGSTLLTTITSFHVNRGEVSLVGGAVDAPAPEDLPALQDWVPKAPESLRALSSSWVDFPPPVEIRIAEAPTFLGGGQATGARSHWMRLAHSVGNDPALHAALLAHASDYLLLDMAFRSHPVPFSSGRVIGTSLDHSMWFHRPVRFDRWHHYTQETVALAGERGLVRGAIRDGQGDLIASTAQEVLVRVTDDQEQQ